VIQILIIIITFNVQGGSSVDIKSLQLSNIDTCFKLKKMLESKKDKNLSHVIKREVYCIKK
jgi:hypothetical protein